MYAPGFRWRPWVSASFCVAGVDNVHCQGVGCIRTGVPLASLGLRLFCVAGVGQCALPRGRMYAPGFRWRPWVSASFAWQAWDNVHCQGVGCTPRGSAGVPGSPPLFAWQAWDNVHCQGVGCTPRGSAGVPGSPPLLRGRRGTMCTAKGSDVRPGVPLASLGLRLFCVAGVGQCALSRGRIYAPGFRWRPWVSASFAWQAWDNVHCQGVGCTPRGSAGVPGSPPLFAWQAWDNVHCQGAGCTPRGSAGVPGSPPLLRGRRGTMCTAKGSDARPGVPLASLGLRLFCVAGVGQCALSRGRMYAPGFRWRPWVSASFAWQAWDNVHCQGVGCTPRGSAGVPGSPPLLRGRRGTMCTVKGSDVRPGVPLASLGLPPLLRGRRGTMCTAKGSDVRPGVPLASLGLRLFCVAGVGQCALPRGWMYVPGFRWRPWVSASFAWQAWGNVRRQGAGCTPRSSAGVPGSPPLLRGRHGPPPHSPHLASPHLTSPHSCTRSPTHSLPRSLPPSVSHSLTSLTLTSLTHTHHTHITHSHSHSLTCTRTYIHTHKLIHHHPSITLILPLPFLIFYAQSKSREVGNMWGYPVL